MFEKKYPMSKIYVCEVVKITYSKIVGDFWQRKNDVKTQTIQYILCTKNTSVYGAPYTQISTGKNFGKIDFNSKEGDFCISHVQPFEHLFYENIKNLSLDERVLTLSEIKLFEHEYTKKQLNKTLEK